MTFKEAVDYYRKQKGYTQKELAEMIKSSATQFSKWLTEENQIPYDAVNEICVHLQLEPRQQIELFELAGYPLPPCVGKLLSQVKAPVALETEYGLKFNPLVFGVYVGESYQYRLNEEGEREKIPDTENIEEFEITKTTGAPVISGSSFKKTTRVLESTWNGRLWNVANGTTFYFAVDLEADLHELAIWVLHWTPESVHGFFYSGRGNQRFSYELVANKKG